MFPYFREKESEGNVSDNSLAKYLSSSKGYLDFESLSGDVTDICCFLLLKSNDHLLVSEAFKHTAPHSIGKLFNPSQREERVFDVGVVSSQSSLGH